MNRTSKTTIIQKLSFVKYKLYRNSIILSRFNNTIIQNNSSVHCTNKNKYGKMTRLVKGSTNPLK